MKLFSLYLAVGILLVGGGQVLARHVTHPVTPANIDKQPFSFTVNVKTVGEFKEFEIVVQKKAGKRAPVVSAYGTVTSSPRGKEAESPSITKVQSGEVQTYTFRIASSNLDRAYFTFTETPEDPRTPFPYPGDYWVFDLSDFVSGPKK